MMVLLFNNKYIKQIIIRNLFESLHIVFIQMHFPIIIVTSIHASIAFISVSYTHFGSIS